MNFFKRKIALGLLSFTIFSSLGLAQVLQTHVHQQELARTLRYVQRIANQEGSFASSEKLDQLLRSVLATHDLLFSATLPDSIEALLQIRNQDCNSIKNIYHDRDHQRGINPILVDLVNDVLVNYCDFSAMTLNEKPVNVLILQHNDAFSTK